MVVVERLAAIGSEKPASRRTGAPGIGNDNAYRKGTEKVLRNWSELKRRIRIDDDLFVRRGPTGNAIADLDSQRFDCGCSRRQRK